MEHLITARTLERVDGRTLWVIEADGTPIGERHSRRFYTHAVLIRGEAADSPPSVLSFHESEEGAEKARQSWLNRVGELAYVLNLDEAANGCDDLTLSFF